jgi:hypothetical protein
VPHYPPLGRAKTYQFSEIVSIAAVRAAIVPTSSMWGASIQLSNTIWGPEVIPLDFPDDRAAVDCIIESWQHYAAAHAHPSSATPPTSSN